MIAIKINDAGQITWLKKHLPKRPSISLSVNENHFRVIYTFNRDM
jgi:hypothetical protein